jgi:arylsulfatase A-like enzyme
VTEHRRPNVLLLITDQHRLDHTGFGGNAVVSTPNLDGLARRSTSFTNAFAANPICMPNRATLLTGRMPSAHGTRTNGISLDWDVATFVRELRRSGYRTGLVGKAHFQNMGTGKAMVDLLRGTWAAREAIEPHHPDRWDEWENQDRYRMGDVELPDDFYGFEHVELTVGHADVVSGHYLRWLLEQGVDPATSQGPQPGWPTYPGWWQLWQSSLPPELHPTGYIGARTRAYLEDAAARPEPFVLQCSFPDPHHPFSPPGDYWAMYDPRDMPLPATFDDPHTSSMPHVRQWRSTRGAEPPQIPVMPFAPTEETYREAAAKEYGSIAFIDDTIGEILRTLDETGQADDTIVVFTSDHGEMFGDHGLMLKGAMHYRPALRVPLLVATPGRAGGQVCEALVGTVDLAQTLLDLTGVAPFEGMQGEILTPLLDDATAEVREHLVVEEDEPYDMAMTGGPLRMRTLLTADARLSIYRGTDQGELFDLDDDPDELINRFAEPAAIRRRGELFEVLARELADLDDRGNVPTYGA